VRMSLSKELSLSNPVFAHYAFYGTVVLTKMMAMSLLTATKRLSKGIFANPEDLPLGVQKPKSVSLNDERVERVRRNHLNDVENIPAFLLLGLLYVTTAPSVTAALWHFRVFTAARLLHTVAYQLPLPQPTRALTFGAGLAVCVSMAYQVLVASAH